jgi:hypothetical protein
MMACAGQRRRRRRVIVWRMGWGVRRSDSAIRVCAPRGDGERGAATAGVAHRTEVASSNEQEREWCAAWASVSERQRQRCMGGRAPRSDSGSGTQCGGGKRDGATAAEWCRVKTESGEQQQRRVVVRRVEMASATERQRHQRVETRRMRRGSVEQRLWRVAMSRAGTASAQPGPRQQRRQRQDGALPASMPLQRGAPPTFMLATAAGMELRGGGGGGGVRMPQSRRSRIRASCASPRGGHDQ